MVGAALVAVYVLAIAGTLPFGHNVRPLFEGIGPPPSYRWVKPPAALAPGNLPPAPNDTDIAMTPTGSQQSGTQSEDTQLVLNLAPNAVPPHPPDTAVRIHIEALDPAKLGPVPPEFRANGNAYRVTMTYQPSGTPATTITAPGNILLIVPLPPAGLLSSPDGQAWTNIGKQTVAGQPIVGGPFSAVGLYLGATHPQTASAGGGGGSGGVIIVAVLVGVLALALGLLPLLRRRGRGGPRGSAAPAPAPAKKARPVKKATKKRR
ncbi:MAG: hypothetical protein JOZ04_13325 [Acidimicrobiia bacterium]|nr:hypothetical protein [Acidimicrobiia bacterium]